MAHEENEQRKELELKLIELEKKARNTNSIVKKVLEDLNKNPEKRHKKEKY